MKRLSTVTSTSNLAKLLKTDTSNLLRLANGSQQLYYSFKLPKPDGSYRLITPPRENLKKLQKSILDLLYKQVKLAPYIHGGVPKHSCKDHAFCHVGKKMVATLDIEKFFDSTHPEFVQNMFLRIGCSNDIAEILVKLTTYNNSLPQGAPTSTMISNLVFQLIDFRLIKLCKKHHLYYGRFVDDIAISGNDDFYSLKGSFKDIIENGGYKVKKEKIKFMKCSQQQIVTGLVVNKEMRPTKDYEKEVKNDIWACINSSAQIVADMQGITKRDLKNSLTGKVAHIRRFHPKVGKKFYGLMCKIDWST